MNFLIALVIGVLIALLIVSLMKGQLKSVHMEKEAAEYIRKNSFHLTKSQDHFLYKRLDKTPRQKENMKR
jgi:uncharacterized membrane-anchored protein YhcB (DUF1043 family)